MDSTNCHCKREPYTSLLFNVGTLNASKILGIMRKTSDMLATHSGDVEDNVIDLIQFSDALPFGHSSNAHKSSIRMKLWKDEEGNHAE